MKYKVTVKGFCQNKRLKDVSEIVKTMDVGIKAIGFPMEFSFITPSKVDKKYLDRFKKYLLSNEWNEDLMFVSIEEISMSFISK